METQDNNKAIAEFNGIHIKEEDGVTWYQQGDKGYIPTPPPYNSHWDLLMDIVEKIENLNCTVRIANNTCSIDQYTLEGGSVKELRPVTNGYIEKVDKLAAVYAAVNEFIIYHNKQQEKP